MSFKCHETDAESDEIFHNLFSKYNAWLVKIEFPYLTEEHISAV